MQLQLQIRGSVQGCLPLDLRACEVLSCVVTQILILSVGVMGRLPVGKVAELLAG